jgi:hypothetical protein
MRQIARHLRAVNATLESWHMRPERGMKVAHRHAVSDAVRPPSVIAAPQQFAASSSFFKGRGRTARAT